MSQENGDWANLSFLESLTRNVDTGKFNNNEDHFILDQDEDNAETANYKGDIVTIAKKDLFSIEDWIIRRQVEAWFLVQTSEPGVRKTLLTNIIINMSNKTVEYNIEETDMTTTPTSKHSRPDVYDPTQAVNYTQCWEPHSDPTEYVTNSCSHPEPAN